MDMTLGTLKSNQCGPPLLLKDPGHRAHSMAAAPVVHLAPGFWACDSIFLSEVLGIPEHEDGVIDLQRRAQFDLHHLDDVRLSQEQEGFAINLLHVNT